MNPLCHPLRTSAMLCSALLITLAAHPQSAVISLDPATLRPPATAPVKGEATYANPPANFYAFASAKVGQPAEVEGLRLRFAAPTTLKSIESTKDFTVEQGGSCKEGESFAKGDTCILLVRFTPQGAGPRNGHIVIAHSASPQPLSLGLGGNGYAPVVSFFSSTVTTVTGTYPSGHGLLAGAQNLAVDGSDGLYIADTGNNVIRYIDSSGAISTLATGLTSPLGIGVDTFGDVYFDEPSLSQIWRYSSYFGNKRLNGTGNDACSYYGSPCALSSENVDGPGQMSMDPYNNLFIGDGSYGVAISAVQPFPTIANLFVPPVFDPTYYYVDPMAVDSADNIYFYFNNYLYGDGNACEIARISLANAANFQQIYSDIVGTRTCGFTGDGGQAGNAEISSMIGQMTFDIAGNLYFTDTNNQRVRRVSATTGIITTIAGDGTAGYTGDGNQSTNATLSSPTGIAVDSHGQVFVISNSAATGTAQVVRKLGPKGELAFSTQNTGTSSAARIVNMANIGNSTLTLTSYFFSGTNPGDFSIDPHTTSCFLTVGATLAAGQSCNIGFIFKPAAAGSRSATLTFLDNTVTSSNIVQLSGTGTTPAPAVVATPSTFAFPATAPNHTSAQPITITNTGSGALSISAITIAGANPAMFGYTSSCGASLAPKATCTLLVNFKPSSTGSYSANFKIADNAPDNPQTISVSGTSAAPSPTTILLAPTSAASSPCSSVAFQVQVSASSDGVPTGTAHLRKGALVVASAQLNNGVAVFSSAGLSSGLNLISATYDGDQIHNPSTSSVLRQVVASGQACTFGRLQLHP